MVPPEGAYYSNGKSENGVNVRTPSDPNGCSAVRAHTQHQTGVSLHMNPPLKKRLCSRALSSCLRFLCLVSRVVYLVCGGAGVQGEAPCQVRLLSTGSFVAPGRPLLPYKIHAHVYSVCESRRFIEKNIHTRPKTNHPRSDHTAALPCSLVARHVSVVRRHTGLSLRRALFPTTALESTARYGLPLVDVGEHARERRM